MTAGRVLRPLESGSRSILRAEVSFPRRPPRTSRKHGASIRVWINHRHHGWFDDHHRLHCVNGHLLLPLPNDSRVYFQRNTPITSHCSVVSLAVSSPTARSQRLFLSLSASQHTSRLLSDCQSLSLTCSFSDSLSLTCIPHCGPGSWSCGAVWQT